MNEAGRNALRAAALAGVRQIRGQDRDEAGGRCAFGVLDEARGWPTGFDDFLVFYGMESRTLHRCPLCRSPRPRHREGALLLHMNDRHRCDFFKIAELMPVSEAP
jgi:hypothetical protein